MKSNEGGLSHEQTSLYSKIDIFFPVHAKGRLRLERNREEMLNGLLAKTFGVKTRPHFLPNLPGVGLITSFFPLLT
jgi:hypothetical protein